MRVKSVHFVRPLYICKNSACLNLICSMTAKFAANEIRKLMITCWEGTLMAVLRFRSAGNRNRVEIVGYLGALT